MSQDFSCQSEEFFPTQLTWQWALKMAKVLWCRFEKYFGKFTMLLLEGSSETGLFRHLSDYVSESLTSKIQTLCKSSFSSKCLKFNLDFKNPVKTKKKINVSDIFASDLVSINCLC